MHYVIRKKVAITLRPNSSVRLFQTDQDRRANWLIFYPVVCNGLGIEKRSARRYSTLMQVGWAAAARPKWTHTATELDTCNFYSKTRVSAITTSVNRRDSLDHLEISFTRVGVVAPQKRRAADDIAERKSRHPLRHPFREHFAPWHLCLNSIWLRVTVKLGSRCHHHRTLGLLPFATGAHTRTA